MYLNREDNTYAEISYFSNLEASEWSWATQFMDVTLNGFEDIIVNTGFKLDFQNLDSQLNYSQQMIEGRNEDGSVGEYARRTLDQLVRGESIPKALSYPVQTWTFGEDLAMVFLAGEVVVDYSLRLKDSLGGERIWINAYSNETPTYIASSRVISEGRYESECSMYSYGHPGRFVRQIEDLIIAGVYELLPTSYLK